MLNVTKLLPRGQGLSAVLLKRAATVSLDWATRQSAHFEASDLGGRALHVSLTGAAALRDGDVLVAEDGSLIRVQAAAEAVMEVRPCPDHGHAADLARAAYQLGQRHVPVAVHGDRLTLPHDAELGAWLRAQHLEVADAHAPFEPEAAWSAHGDHDHDHDHDHAHGHDHAHHAQGQARHEHGPGCGHDHGHDHARDHEGCGHPGHAHHKG